MDTRFRGELIEWRGPAPFYWVPLTGRADGYVRAEAAEATYGWGAIPVRARIGDTEWETSLLPKDGRYLLPVKQLVRDRERIALGDRLTIELSIAPRGGRAANGTGPTC